MIRFLPLFFIAATPVLAASPAARVTVVEVRQDHVVEQIQLTGTVTAERQASLSSRASGLVSKVHVDAGDRVEAGEILLELDPALAEVDVKRATNAHREAESRLAEARRRAAEGRQLVKTRALPTTEAEARDAEVLIAEAAFAQAEADRQEAGEILKRHELPAPFGGIISHKAGEAGEWVETGDVVLELVEIDRLRLDVRAPQEWLHLIPDDGTATVELEGISGHSLPAKVRRKVRVPDPTSRSFLVRLDVEDPEKLMAPGMSASAEFTIIADREALVIPRDAIVRLPSGIVQVWRVVEKEGNPVAEPRHVVIGQSSGDQVEIREGLSAGDRVVVRGNETLRDGQSLEILPAGKVPST